MKEKHQHPTIIHKNSVPAKYITVLFSIAYLTYTDIPNTAKHQHTRIQAKAMLNKLRSFIHSFIPRSYISFSCVQNYVNVNHRSLNLKTKHHLKSAVHFFFFWFFVFVFWLSTLFNTRPNRKTHCHNKSTTTRALFLC